MNKILAFADEFGNNSFDFEKQGSHFIIATVISRSENIENLKLGVEEIKRKHKFQTGEIKSSGVAGNHIRRKKILSDIVKLNISVYAVIVDKRKLSGEGFKYKKSFYKFLNNLLYKELYRTFPELDLYVDEHGGNDFMCEFKKYVAKNHPRNLFSGSEFNIKNSKNNEFIQVADFVAGSLGYIYDEQKKSEHSQDFLNILSPIVSSLNVFPREITFKELKESNIDTAFDEGIAHLSFLRIRDFLDREVGNTQQRVDQINLLKLLLWLQRAFPQNRYVSTKEIFKHMNQSRDEEIQEEYFRTKIIGNLRDKGILIASGRQGYKIPTSANDLDSFINHGQKIIIPMLKRIKEARNAVMLATQNSLDLLEKHSELKKIIEK